MTYSAAPMPEGTPSYQPHMAASNPGGLAAAFKEPKRPTFVFVFAIFYRYRVPNPAFCGVCPNVFIFE